MQARGVTGGLGVRAATGTRGVCSSPAGGLSLVLLVCAGLLMRSLQRVEGTQAGLDATIL